MAINFDDFKSFKEMHAAIEKEYGKDWAYHGRFADVTPWEEAERLEKEFVKACYRLYPIECEKRCVLKSDDEDYNGRPFEIVGTVDVDDPGYDLIALPIFKVRMLDDGDEFVTYPEEIFVNA